MRWDNALEAVYTELRQSNALYVALLKVWAIYKHSAPRTPRIPSVALTYITEGYRESINDLELQVSIFSHGVPQSIAIERAVRDALDRYVWGDVGGLYMRCQLIGSTDVTDPEEGVVHRALDFGISLPRERYIGAEAS